VPQTSTLPPGFDWDYQQQPGTLLSLCCPLVATEGKAVTEPAALVSLACGCSVKSLCLSKGPRPCSIFPYK
jgi:hypothetical protein